MKNLYNIGQLQRTCVTGRYQPAFLKSVTFLFSLNSQLVRVITTNKYIFSTPQLRIELEWPAVSGYPDSRTIVSLVHRGEHSRFLHNARLLQTLFILLTRCCSQRCKAFITPRTTYASLYSVSHLIPTMSPHYLL